MSDHSFHSGESAFASQQERLRTLRTRTPAPNPARTTSSSRRAVARRLRSLADAFDG